VGANTRFAVPADAHDRIALKLLLAQKNNILKIIYTLLLKSIDTVNSFQGKSRKCYSKFLLMHKLFSYRFFRFHEDCQMSRTMSYQRLHIP